MEHNLKHPCNDCPWRRIAMRGWLGNGTPEYFVSSALADEFGEGTTHAEGHYAEACHQTIDFTDPEWGETQAPNAEACVGSAIFYRNVDRFKLPRDPNRSRMIQGVQPDHETVFSTPEEFIEHHTANDGIGSWNVGEVGSDA